MATNWLDDYFGPGSVQDEATDLPKRPVIAFVGPTVTANDDPTNKRTVVTVVPSQLVADVTGFGQVKAPIQRTTNAHAGSKEYEVDVLTPTTAPTVIFSLPLTSKRKYTVRGICSVLNDPVSAFAEWDVRISARNSPTGPIVEIINPTTAITLIAPSSTTFVLAASIVGSNLVITATDPAGGRRWTLSLLVIEQVFT